MNRTFYICTIFLILVGCTSLVPAEEDTSFYTDCKLERDFIQDDEEDPEVQAILKNKEEIAKNSKTFLVLQNEIAYEAKEKTIREILEDLRSRYKINVIIDEDSCKPEFCFGRKGLDNPITQSFEKKKMARFILGLFPGHGIHLEQGDVHIYKNDFEPEKNDDRGHSRQKTGSLLDRDVSERRLTAIGLS